MGLRLCWVFGRSRGAGGLRGYEGPPDCGALGPWGCGSVEFWAKAAKLADCEAMKGRRTAELWDHGTAALLGFWPKPRGWRTARL